MMMLVTVLAIIGMVVCLALLFSVRAKTAIFAVTCAGIGLFLVLVQSGSDAPRKTSTQPETRFGRAATPYRVQPDVGQSSSASRLAAERARYAELGDKPFPSPSELREFLLLDGRFAVEEGEWSAGDFEEYTGEKY